MSISLFTYHIFPKLTHQTKCLCRCVRCRCCLLFPTLLLILVSSQHYFWCWFLPSITSEVSFFPALLLMLFINIVQRRIFSLIPLKSLTHLFIMCWAQPYHIDREHIFHFIAATRKSAHYRYLDRIIYHHEKH